MVYKKKENQKEFLSSDCKKGTMKEVLSSPYSYLLWKFLTWIGDINEENEIETEGYGIITLRKIFDLPDTGDYYIDVVKLNKEIVKPAMLEVNKKTEYNVKGVLKKPRGNVVGIAFKVKKKKRVSEETKKIF